MKILILIVAVLLYSASAFSQTVPLEHDTQIWNDTSVLFPLIKSKDNKNKPFERLSFSINGTLRFGRSVSRPVDERIGFAFNYRLNRFVNLVPDVIYRAAQPYRGRKDYETRFRFAVILSNAWEKFAMANRSQIEYRLRNTRQNSVRYKNRFRFDYPLTRAKKVVFTPFVSDEPFYDFQVKQWTRNEFFAGIGKKLNNNLSADFYWLFVNDKSFPKRVIGIGVSLKFRID